MTHRNIYMTDELQAIYDQTVEFVQREVTPHGEQWELDGKIPARSTRKWVNSACSVSASRRTWWVRTRNVGLSNVF